MKLEFQIENGTEDIFKVVQKSDNIKTEVNGFKGIIKTTILDENGMEVNTFIENYFETLENMNESSKIIESEMTRATKIIPSNQFGSGTIASYFSPYIKVDRDTRDRIRICSIHTSQVKRYSKDKYNWNSGNTLKFYNYINESKTNWNNIGKSISGTVLAKVAARLSGMFVKGIFGMTPSAIVDFLATLGIVVTGGSALVINIGKFIGSMNNLHNTWKKI